MSILDTAVQLAACVRPRDVPPSDGLSTDDPSTDDPSSDVVELGSQIVGLAGRVAAATCRWLLLVAAFDERQGYVRFNLVSTARWLSHACGISHRTAVDHVRVARALAGFPVLAQALQAGRISYCHARAISRVAGPGEDRTVVDLIGVAEHGTVGQLEALVRGLRTVERAEAAESSGGSGAGSVGNAGGEYVRHSWASQSSQWRLSARLDPERGALVEHAIGAVAQAELITHADALVRLAEIGVAALNHRVDGPPRGLRGDERAAVLIHLSAADVPQPAPATETETETETETDPEAGVTAEARAGAGPGSESMRDGGDAPDGARADERGSRSRERDADTPQPQPQPGSGSGSRPFAWLEDGPGLPRPVIERLLCACRVRPVIHAPDGSVLDLGRTRRLVDDRLFRALLLRDRHCAHPGCSSRHKIEAHHVIHWLHGGRTDMANLVLLCERHHHQHHDGQFSITRLGSPRRGRFEFRAADGRELPAHIDPSQLIDPSLPPVETDFPHLPDQAIRSRTVGDRLDRAWAVAVLAQRRQADPGKTDRGKTDPSADTYDPWAA